MALAKKNKRILSYVLILGGLAVSSLVFFTVSQFEKAKCDASTSTLKMCENKLNKLTTAYKKEQGISEVDMATFLQDETSHYHDAAVYWNSNLQFFIKETDKNSTAYKITAVPAYILSMSTLVAFGLILKHAEKAKEKEDEEAALG